MKENTQNTLLIVGGVAVLGYFLYKSDVFKGLGQISTGAGQAAQGIGEGVSSAFIDTGQAVGDISGSIADATENILNLLSPLGALGVNIARNFENTGENKSALRQDVYNKSFETISDLRTESEIFKEQEKAERKAERQDFYSDTQTELITGIQTYNPLNVLNSFVQGIKNIPQSLSITNASIRENKTASSSSSSSGYIVNSAASGISGGLGLSSSDINKLTSLNIPLQSTAAGVQIAYTPQTPQKSSRIKKLFERIF